jgi:hypothetical protein
MAFLGEEDAHPYGQNDLAVNIEKSTLQAPKVTVSKIVDGLTRRKGLGVRASGCEGRSPFGPTCAARRGRLATIIGCGALCGQVVHAFPDGKRCESSVTQAGKH